MASDTINEQFLDAARSGNVSELRMLLSLQSAADDPLDVNYQDELNGVTAVHMAAANGHLDALKFLLTECRPTPDYKANKSGNTPLHWALQNSEWESAKLILVNGQPGAVDVLQKNEFGNSCLSLSMNQQSKLRAANEEVENSLPDPGSVEALSIEVLKLILEHPSAAALETESVEA